MSWSNSTDSGRSGKSFDFRAESIALIVGLLATVFALIFVFQLWDFNPRVPIFYSGDGLLTLNGLRNMKFGNWYWSTNKLGAPFGQDLHDFPAVADNFHLAILWIGIKLLRNEVIAFNLYFFGSYLLTTVTGYVAARMLNLDRRAAVMIGVVYSFVPYHFLQGPGHLFLAAYWAVPLWVAFLVRELLTDSISPTLPTSLKLNPLLLWARQKQTIFIILISITAASTGLYYAFFFLILGFFVLAIIRVSQSQKLQWVPTAFALCTAIITMAFQYLPVWLYQKSHGNNLSIVERTVAAIEFYSLKLSNVVLPVVGHRLSFFAELRDKSNPSYLIGEGSEALGLFGSIGLVSLICLAIYRLSKPKSELSTALSTFTMLSIFICTAGGLSQIIAVFGFTQLRVWSRMSIVMAFPAIIFAVILLEKCLRKRGSVVTILLMVLVTSLSILDMNPGKQLPSFRDTARAWELDRYLVKEVEAAVGPDGLVFQLPVVPFPENPAVVNMSDYAHLRGYLHSESLRWSYGAIKGRSAFEWQKSLVNTKALLSKLRDQDFSAIWIDRRGYADLGESLVNELTSSGLKLTFINESTFVFLLK